MGGSSSKYGPANRNNFQQDIIHTFSKIINQPYDKTLRDITRLRSRTLNAYPDHFINGIDNLPNAHMGISFRGVSFESGDDELEIITYITGGANGKIYIGNRTHNVYKKIIIDISNKPTRLTDKEYMERKYKEIYLEVFIQSLLQNDPVYSDNIGRIERLYVDIDNSEILYIKMEHIANMNLKTFLNSLKGVNGLVSFVAIKPILRHIAVILNHFLKKYGFYHGDLHGGNILFANDVYGVSTNRIKIIDFGYSCIKSIDTGRIFSVYDRPCKSYDLLIYIMYLLQYQADKFDQGALNFFDSLTQLPGLPAGNDLFSHAKMFLQSEGLWTNPDNNTIFHLMYSIKIDERHPFWDSITPGTGSTMYTNFVPLLEQNFLPEGFITAIDNYNPSTAATAPIVATAATAATAATTPPNSSSSNSSTSHGGRRKHTRRKHRTHKNKKLNRGRPH